MSTEIRTFHGYSVNKEARIAALQNTAIATLGEFGIEQPTPEQIFKMASALVKAKSSPEPEEDSPESKVSWDETLACIREFEASQEDSTPEDSTPEEIVK